MPAPKGRRLQNQHHPAQLRLHSTERRAAQEVVGQNRVTYASQQSGRARACSRPRRSAQRYRGPTLRHQPLIESCRHRGGHTRGKTRVNAVRSGLISPESYERELRLDHTSELAVCLIDRVPSSRAHQAGSRRPGCWCLRAPSTSCR
jgi:hypothetical protein